MCENRTRHYCHAANTSEDLRSGNDEKKTDQKFNNSK